MDSLSPTMQTPWFDFGMTRSLGTGLLIGLVLGAFLRALLVG